MTGTRDVSEQLKSLRDCFFSLCKDDTPMVRRAAAKNISAVFGVFEDEHISLFVTQYDEFMRSDDVRFLFSPHRQEAIKLTLMSFTKELLQRLKEDSDRAKVLSLFQNAMESRSYKIREAAALEVGAVAGILGSAVFSQQLLETFLNLLKDNNVEVKKNAIKQLTPLSKVLPRDAFLSKLFPFVSTLATDTNAAIT